MSVIPSETERHGVDWDDVALCLVHYTYGSAGGMNDALNRLAAINDDTGGNPGNALAEYAYLGLGTIVAEDYAEPDVKLDYDSGTPVREEDWSLDMTGNWAGYVQKTSGTTDLNQTRGHNQVNEITSASSWATPAHDRAGNMTTIPKPSSLANSLSAFYDAWNRLVEIKDGQIVVGRYEYDGDQENGTSLDQENGTSLISNAKPWTALRAGRQSVADRPAIVTGDTASTWARTTRGRATKTRRPGTSRVWALRGAARLRAASPIRTTTWCW